MEPAIPQIPALFLEFRRYLTAHWRADTPDLQVSAWRDPAVSRGFHYLVEQQFLALPDDTDMAFASIERWLLEKSDRRGGAQRNLGDFLFSWHFIHLPVVRADAVIQTVRRGGRLEHRIEILSPDDAPARMRVGPRQSIADLLSPLVLGYRNAVAAWITDRDPQAAARRFSELLESEATLGACHAWLALIAHRTDADTREVRRRLALAHEFAPDVLITRLASREIIGETKAGRRLELPGTDIPADATPEFACLLANALMMHELYKPARTLCERVLERHPQHREMQALAMRIAHRERRAQT